MKSPRLASMRLLIFTPGAVFFAMSMETAAREQELSAAMDRTAETAMDFMVATAGGGVVGGSRGGREQRRAVKAGEGSSSERGRREGIRVVRGQRM